MMTRIQERSLRHTIKHGGSLELPGHAGRSVLIEIIRHRTFIAISIGTEGCREPERLYGPAREVYPLAAELLDSLVVPQAPQAPEVAHG